MAKSVLSEPRFHNEEAAYEYVEKRLWPAGPVCPFCKADKEKVGKLAGKTTRIGLYKCYACRKPFTVKIGTIFESSHVKLHMWLQAIHLLCSSKKGFSTRQLQRTLGCGMKTAWFLGHRIREAMKDGAPMPLGGDNEVVEVDETYVGGKAKNRAYREPLPKKAVVALVERDGRARSFHVASVTSKTLKPIIKEHAKAESFLMTDESPIYPGIAREFGGHGTVNHSADEYVRLGGFLHTNTVENFFSVMKRGIYGTYQHVSEAHLQRYLDEFSFRHNEREALGVNDVSRADRALVGAKGKRLTYRTTH